MRGGEDTRAAFGRAKGRGGKRRRQCLRSQMRSLAHGNIILMLRPAWGKLPAGRVGGACSGRAVRSVATRREVPSAALGKTPVPWPDAGAPLPAADTGRCGDILPRTPLWRTCGVPSVPALRERRSFAGKGAAAADGPGSGRRCRIRRQGRAFRRAGTGLSACGGTGGRGRFSCSGAFSVFPQRRKMPVLRMARRRTAGHGPE